MSEWWTYRLSDFLLFAPRTYYRLFELYNADIWPAQLVALALGLAILILLTRGPAARGRIIAAILVVAWLWVAWAFHLERYATINWVAIYFAAGFALQALLLIWIGIIRDRLQFQLTAQPASRAALGLFLFALLVQPAIGPLLGRPWTQAELFGVAPDPTAVATLALLLAADRPPWQLMVLPAMWCILTGLTLWTMGSPDAFVAPVVVLFVLGLAIARRRSALRSSGTAGRLR
jgi:hypothetical protein